MVQEPTLHPWLTVAQNLAVPLRLRGVPAPERARARQRVLELVRLSDRAEAYPRQLSGGQKMRVSLARALIVSPRKARRDRRRRVWRRPGTRRGSTRTCGQKGARRRAVSRGKRSRRSWLTNRGGFVP
ncbi:MAG: ATP-binding cassette domain-containing protein [Opitutaceae bacterium]